MSGLNIEELLRPPTEAEVEAALGTFARAAHAHYGGRLAGLFLFGSRARGDHRPESDIDVAIVLSKFEKSAWDETKVFSDLVLDFLTDHGVHLQIVPIRLDDWRDSDPDSDLLYAVKRDARALDVAA